MSKNIIKLCQLKINNNNNIISNNNIKKINNIHHKNFKILQNLNKNNNNCNCLNLIKIIIKTNKLIKDHHNNLQKIN